MIYLYKSLRELLNPSDFKKIIFLSLLLFVIVILEVFGVLVITLLVSSIADLDKALTQFNNIFSYINIFNFTFQASINDILIGIITYIIASVFIYTLAMRFISLETQLITSNLKSNFISTTLSASWIENLNQNTSQRISNILNDTTQIGFTLIDLMHLLSRTYLAILLIFWLFIANPIITSLIVLILFSLYTFIHFNIKSSLALHGDESVKFNQHLVRSITNMFGHIKEIIFYDNQAKQEEALRDINLTIAHSTGQKIFLINLPRFLIDSLILIMLVGGVAYYANLGFVSENFYSTVSIFGIASIKILPAIQNIFYYTQQIVARKSNLKNLLNFYEHNEANLDKVVTQTLFPVDILKNIEFNNVNFEYSKSSNVLLDLSASIEIGEKIAIVGPSGSGKSTFLDLLIGILPPTSGKILVDSKKINTSNLIKYRQNFSYVPQKIFLTDDSIRENILLYSTERNNDLIQDELLQESKVSNFLKSFENGINTSISESSQMISGGEKQCIGFARAFVQDKQIIVLDEATSSMDKDLSLSLIKTAITKSSTVICATHQSHLLHLFDKIMVFDNGRLVKVDTLENLTRNDKFVSGLMNAK